MDSKLGGAYACLCKKKEKHNCQNKHATPYIKCAVGIVYAIPRVQQLRQLRLFDTISDCCAELCLNRQIC